MVLVIETGFGKIIVIMFRTIIANTDITILVFLIITL